MSISYDLYSYGLYVYGLYRYGLFEHAIHSCDLYSYVDLIEVTQHRIDRLRLCVHHMRAHARAGVRPRVHAMQRLDSAQCVHACAHREEAERVEEHLHIDPEQLQRHEHARGHAVGDADIEPDNAVGDADIEPDMPPAMSTYQTCGRRCRCRCRRRCR